MQRWFPHHFGAVPHGRRACTYPDVAAAFPLMRLNILVTESHALVREVITRALSVAGFNGIAADDATQARAIYRDVPLSCCIIDVSRSGDTSGVELLRWLRRQEEALPVVLTCGMGMDDVKLRPDHALRIIAKPFGARSLIELLGGLIMPSGEASAAMG
ncbi:MAG: response regulator [Alphaproteobacteria bacterium]|nr:response regulator [Alphaproteobacteria bacterium]